MRTIHIMSAPPASGKSTYIAANKADSDIVLSRDEMRNNMRTLTGSKDYFPASAAVEWDAWIKYITAYGIKQDADIWIDQTTASTGSFNKLIKALNLLLTSKDFVILELVNTPMSVSLERNAARDAETRVPDHIITGMYKTFTDLYYYVKRPEYNPFDNVGGFAVHEIQDY